MAERLLLLGVYGMELVEAGGALAANAAAGGTSYASLMFCSPQMRAGISRAGSLLDTEVSFVDFDAESIDADPARRAELVGVLRRVRPTVVITQDPEHSLADLDPGRRPAMTLILEALSLCARDWLVSDGQAALDRVPTVYYMSPLRPNCVVDVTPHWSQKTAAMNGLDSQLEYTAVHWEAELTSAQLDALVPGYADLEPGAERGRALHTVLDRANHIHHGLGHHGRFPFAEVYRRETLLPLGALPS